MMGAYPKPAAQRFAEKVRKDPASDCWLWNPNRSSTGYGAIQDDSGSRIGVHRWSYEHHVGPIPDGMLIDHICRNTRCVNPDHLRLAGRKQNAENTVIRSTNKSGFTGVSWSKVKKGWRAYVTHNCKQVHVGYFSTAEAAGEAAKAKRLELFTCNEADR